MSMPNNQMRRMLSGARRVADEFSSVYFSYSMQFTAVASAATANANMQIQADSNFMIMATSFFAFDTVTNAQVAAPTATILLTDSGSGAQLFDRALPIMTTFGTASLPFILPVERVLAANSNLAGVLVNGVVANAITFFLVFHGCKLYRG